MNLRDFNNAHNAARRRIRREGVDAVAPAEDALRALLPELPSDEDRRIAAMLIDRLPEYAEPVAPPSALMQEAIAIEHAASSATGTDAERIATMAEARRKIWELADRAPDDDEASGIRSLTRILEHLEDNLRNPDWPYEPNDPVDH
jgi:hypothetical protein